MSSDASLETTEDVILVRDLQAKCDQELSFRIETTRSSRFHAIDSERREPGLTSELCFAHHERLAILLYVVDTGHVFPSPLAASAIAPKVTPQPS
jgi:hypothetical protein